MHSIDSQYEHANTIRHLCDARILGKNALYGLTLRPDLDARVLSASNVLQRPLKMQPRHLHAGTRFSAFDIRVYELNKAIEVLRRNL